MAFSHVHPHTHRRLWLESSGTRFLVSLGEACLYLSLPRLEQLVEDVLHERFKDEPAVALDPELVKLNPLLRALGDAAKSPLFRRR
ncbi:MAG: hypothetical protein ACKOZW_05395 [Cyanobium sp.]